MAELIAGAISMGLGGYLGAKSERYFSSLFTSEFLVLTVGIGIRIMRPCKRRRSWWSTTLRPLNEL
jgi:hypothetical protein